MMHWDMLAHMDEPPRLMMPKPAMSCRAAGAAGAAGAAAAAAAAGAAQTQAAKPNGNSGS